MTNLVEFKKLQSKSRLTTAQTITPHEIGTMLRCIEAVNGRIPITPEIKKQIDLLDEKYTAKYGMTLLEYDKNFIAWFDENY